MPFRRRGSVSSRSGGALFDFVVVLAGGDAAPPAGLPGGRARFSDVTGVGWAPGHRLRHLRHRRRPPYGSDSPAGAPPSGAPRPRLPPLLVKSFRLGLPVPLPRPASPPRRSRLARCDPSPSSFAPPDPPPRDLRVLLPCDYKARGVRLRCRSRGRRPVHFQFQAQPGRGWSCLSGGGGPCACGPGGCSSPWSRPCRGPWWRCHGRRGGGDGDLSRKRRCGLCRRWTWRRSLWGDLCCCRCRRVLAGCGRGLRA